MNRILTGAVTMALLLVTTGCAHNAIVACDAVRVGTFFGDLGIKGDGNSITVLRGSRLTKVSFWGNHNNVTLEEGVTAAHVEFFGKYNTISIAESLMVRLTEVGEGNKVIRREAPWALDTGEETVYTLPPTAELTEPGEETAPAEPLPTEETAPPEMEEEEVPGDLSGELEAADAAAEP